MRRLWRAKVHAVWWGVLGAGPFVAAGRPQMRMAARRRWAAGWLVRGVADSMQEREGFDRGRSHRVRKGGLLCRREIQRTASVLKAINVDEHMYAHDKREHIERPPLVHVLAEALPKWKVFLALPRPRRPKGGGAPTCRATEFKD